VDQALHLGPPSAYLSYCGALGAKQRMRSERTILVVRPGGLVNCLHVRTCIAGRCACSAWLAP